MKTIRFLTILLMGLYLSACKKDDDIILYPTVIDEYYQMENPLKLEVSNSTIVLDRNLPKEQALLITWEPLKELEKIYPVKYLLKLDLEANNFTTSTVSITLDGAVDFKVYSNEEMIQLIETYWNKSEVEFVALSARVIAQFENEEKFIKPVYSTANFRAEIPVTNTNPIYLFGRAVSGDYDVSKGKVFTQVPGKNVYYWRGDLSQGSFNIINSVTSDDAIIYGMGAESNEVSDVEEYDNAQSFSIGETGTYAVLIDLDRMEINVEKVFYQNIHIGGSATPSGWNSPPLMSWDPFKPHVCTYTIMLSSGGELKFSTQQNFSSGTPQFFANKPDASIEDDLNLFAGTSPDWKWRVQPGQEGVYLVTVDEQAMTVLFEKK